MAQIKIKRVYEDASDSDGYRILVDRLWPRGMKKENLKYDEWAKDVTPSPGLRKWFHEDMQQRWADFSAMYITELEHSDSVKALLIRIEPFKIVTLLYASRESVYNHARILQNYLETHQKI